MFVGLDKILTSCAAAASDVAEAGRWSAAIVVEEVTSDRGRAVVGGEAVGEDGGL